MYLAEADLIPHLPPQFLLQALDDDGDGSADDGLLDAILTASSDEVDAILGARFATPFSPVPALVKTSARIFALETLYRRRGFSGDNNPWEVPAKDLRARLNRIGQGKEPLTPDIERKQSSVSVIVEDAKTHDSAGRISL
jgi:phage gp36-like protein